MSSVCRLDPIGLEPLFVKVCFRRCHCAPSMFNGPDGKSMVAIPCVVVAMVGPMVESQDSGCSKIRTAPTSGGFLISSKMSSFSKLTSCRILGSLDACGTENLSLSGFGLVLAP